MALNDLGNVKGPKGETGAQGPAGPDLEVRTFSFTKELAASSGEGNIAFDVVNLPTVTGYTPIFVIGETDAWNVAFTPRSIVNNAMYYNIFTVATATAKNVTVSGKVYYQKN